MSTGAPIALIIVQSLLTAVIAAFAAYIAYRQWLAAREKLLLDLFDRRFELYSHMKQALQDVFTLSHKADQFQAFRQFAKYKMLFGDDVVEFVDECHRAVFKRKIIQNKLNAGQNDEHFLNEDQKNIAEISNLSDRIDEVFSPYLRISYSKAEENVFKELCAQWKTRKSS